MIEDIQLDKCVQMVQKVVSELTQLPALLPWWKVRLERCAKLRQILRIKYQVIVFNFDWTTLFV